MVRKKQARPTRTPGDEDDPEEGQDDRPGRKAARPELKDAPQALQETPDEDPPCPGPFTVPLAATHELYVLVELPAVPQAAGGSHGPAMDNIDAPPASSSCLIPPALTSSSITAVSGHMNGVDGHAHIRGVTALRPGLSTGSSRFTTDSPGLIPSDQATDAAGAEGEVSIAFEPQPVGHPSGNAGHCRVILQTGSIKVRSASRFQSL